jgi:hypothetical protein
MRKTLIILKNCFGDKETIFAFFYQLFVGMIGAQIGTVNITGMVNAFVKSQANLNLPSNELNEKVKVFGKNLEASLHEVANEKKVVLLPSEAVIAGGVDYTDYVKQRLKSE